jgi:hypothetical protein
MEVRMDVTELEAASMYARACRAWYGRRAPRVVKDTIKQLRAKNDEAGARMWSLVLWHFFEGSGVFGIPGTRFA